VILLPKTPAFSCQPEAQVLKLRLTDVHREKAAISRDFSVRSGFTTQKMQLQ
jgi:hypothetical protein